MAQINFTKEELRNLLISVMCRMSQQDLDTEYGFNKYDQLLDLLDKLNTLIKASNK